MRPRRIDQLKKKEGESHARAAGLEEKNSQRKKKERRKTETARGIFGRTSQKSEMGL
jgi:hypothetical protein